MSSKKHKYFEEVENAASEIIYRRVNCRKCQKCYNGERIEYISVKEEVEQDIINRSISLDADPRITTATLPIIDDPLLKVLMKRIFTYIFQFLFY